MSRLPPFEFCPVCDYGGMNDIRQNKTFTYGGAIRIYFCRLSVCSECGSYEDGGSFYEPNFSKWLEKKLKEDRFWIDQENDVEMEDLRCFGIR